MWLFNNQLLECPRNIPKLAKLSDLRLDNNPLISPPTVGFLVNIVCLFSHHALQDLLPQGVQAVMRYCRIRSTRIDELAVRLTNTHFEFEIDRLTPVSAKVCTGNTGYLTEADLSDVDKKFDHYVNGDFYLHAPTGEEIVMELYVSCLGWSCIYETDQFAKWC